MDIQEASHQIDLYLLLNKLESFRFSDREFSWLRKFFL